MGFGRENNLAFQAHKLGAATKKIQHRVSIQSVY